MNIVLVLYEGKPKTIKRRFGRREDRTDEREERSLVLSCAVYAGESLLYPVPQGQERRSNNTYQECFMMRLRDDQYIDAIQ